jgi:hypothetical protein
MESAAILALITILGSTLVALFKLLDNNTKALQSLSDTNDKMAKESKQRNGHLGEMITAQSQQTAKNDIAILKAVNNITATQHVDTQQVEHQIVKEK